MHALYKKYLFLFVPPFQDFTVIIDSPCCPGRPGPARPCTLKYYYLSSSNIIGRLPAGGETIVYKISRLDCNTETIGSEEGGIFRHRSAAFGFDFIILSF